MLAFLNGKLNTKMLKRMTKQRRARALASTTRTMVKERTDLKIAHMGEPTPSFARTAVPLQLVFVGENCLRLVSEMGTIETATSHQPK